MPLAIRSRDFDILRGVRQGDPLSPILFANVLRTAMKKLKPEWESKGWGTSIGSNFAEKHRLTHMMFADDATLLAKSFQALVTMIRDLR